MERAASSAELVTLPLLFPHPEVESVLVIVVGRTGRPLQATLFSRQIAPPSGGERITGPWAPLLSRLSSTQKKQTLNRWFGGANRPAETNAQDRCQSAERRVSVPGNSLVYPRRTPEFSQLDATMEWWRLWPKRSGGGGGIRTNGMLCVPLCFFGVFSALQALRNPRQTSSL